MCLALIKPLKVNRLTISSPALVTAVVNTGWRMPFGPLDGEYYYASPEDWASVLSRVFLLEMYQAETYDCENYAMEAMVLVGKKYGLNAFGLAIGDTPAGRHGFNVFYCINGWWVYEPQPGFGLGYFPLGENGYHPELILI